MTEKFTKEELEEMYRRAHQSEEKLFLADYRAYPNSRLARDDADAEPEPEQEPDVLRDGTLPVKLCAALVLGVRPDPVSFVFTDIDRSNALGECEMALRIDLEHGHHILNHKAPRDEHRLAVGRVLEWAAFNGRLDADKAARWAEALGEHVRRAYEKACEARNLPADYPHGNTAVNADKRAQVLRAALAVLAHYPEECRTKEGKVVATRLAGAVENYGYKIWHDDQPLARKTMEDLFRDCLKLFKK